MAQTNIGVGDVIEVTTDRIAYGGDAVARHEGLVVFVPFAATKERMRVRITEKKKNFLRGSIVELLEAADTRRDPPCGYFGNCGGCQLQHIDYAAQLEAKEGFVRDALERIGRIDWPQPIPVHPSPEFGYRSRAQFKLELARRDDGPEEAEAIRVGFNQAGSNSVCDIVSCPILTDGLNQALADLRQRLDHWPFPGRIHEVEAASGGSGYSIQPAFPGLPSGTVQISVHGARYAFEPSVFFQSNLPLLDDLTQAVTGTAEDSLAVDLYCGAGLFTLGLARRFRKVVGVESNVAAARLARKNLASNNVMNAQVLNVSAEEWAKGFVRRRTDRAADRPSLIVLDPPRTGAAAAIDDIACVGSKALTYVSCDPATLARDLRGLINNGYTLDDVFAFDLFPQTYHVETVAKLSLR